MNEKMFNGEFKYSPYVPFDPTRNPIYAGYITSATKGGLQPYEYTNWRDEELSWHENCYLHAGLNPTATYWFKGPDALRFLEENCTNGFKKFKVGKSRHALMCNEDGLLIEDGMLLRLAEDEFISYWMMPYIELKLKQGNYDVVGKNLTGDVFLYQLGGPKSLEIVEAATGENFHDLEFAAHRLSKIDGREVRVLRIGMCGTLAYEVHGNFEDCIPVYNALMEAGEAYGIRRLGRHGYWNAHTENGFMQHAIHFAYARETNKEFSEYLEKTGSSSMAQPSPKLGGSYGSELSDFYVNPIELGWGNMVNFNHEFVGREALMKIKEGPHRETVTLVWNPEDILDIWRSEFSKEEPYAPMDGPEDTAPNGVFELRGDKVLKDGKLIGISTGRIFSWYYREMISLAIIEAEHNSIGSEVVVLWGDPGTRQKEIRATVSRYPYMDENRNENVDTSTIPSGVKK
ncbi:MAG: aminomethyl transferase family protein [Tissierellia bacterium]|nr:aminomethyl transferase family protein [Tissierellia bacterium]